MGQSGRKRRRKKPCLVSPVVFLKQVDVGQSDRKTKNKKTCLYYLPSFLNGLMWDSKTEKQQQQQQNLPRVTCPLKVVMSCPSVYRCSPFLPCSKQARKDPKSKHLSVSLIPPPHLTTTKYSSPKRPEARQTHLFCSVHEETTLKTKYAVKVFRARITSLVC